MSPGNYGHTLLKHIFVFDDDAGEGGKVVKATDVHGKHYVMPLTLEQAAWLSQQFAEATSQLIKRKPGT